MKPDIFWYDAPTKIDLPFNIVGLVLFELVTMHWVETKVRSAEGSHAVALSAGLLSI